MKHHYCWLNVAALLVLCGGSAMNAHAQNGAPLLSPSSTIIPLTNSNQVATDDLGRALPTFAEVGPPKPNRWVGMFYWQWHGPGNARYLPNGQYNMVEYLKTRPYFKDFDAFPKAAPAHPSFYWAEPLFGFYTSTDEWVMRKHLMMLSDAGVDFLFMDYTNGQVYDAELGAFLKVAKELKAQGVAVPRLSFFLNHEPDWKIEHLYATWYLPGQYDDLWFRWRGKPLLMSARPADNAKFKDAALIPAMQNYFTYRQTWAFHDAAKEPTKWRFMHGFNAPVANDPEGRPEQLVVNKSTGGPIWNNAKEGGVSAVEGITHAESDYAPDWTLPDMAQGTFFQNGWNRALQIAPPMLLVTGWNEWQASVWETPGVVMLNRVTAKGQGHIVDEFNPQFNRDLEPMKGGYSDDYYWQFVANMRRYKGMVAPELASGPRTIKINGDFAAWDTVKPEFKDAPNDTAQRDADATVPNIHYTNTSARNDIALCKVAYDGRSIAFYARATAPLTPPTGTNWMTLLIDADQNIATGWHGYDFLINRRREGNRCAVEHNVGGAWQWERVGDAPLRWSGNQLELAVPRRLLGLPPSNALSLDFKWADNLPVVPDIMDFYTQGDVAPNTRFNYRFASR